MGGEGEAAAAAWYRARGYTVVARNWRCRDGEIDLILRAGRLLVFCEVKARTTAAFGYAVEAVTPAKQAKVRQVAQAFLDDRGGLRAIGAIDVRFDVAAIQAGTLDLVEGAF